MSASGHEICLHVMDKVHHASPPNGGDGPLGHYEVVHPGGTQIDQAAEIAALKGLGIDGPYAFALPYGQSEPGCHRRGGREWSSRHPKHQWWWDGPHHRGHRG